MTQTGNETATFRLVAQCLIFPQNTNKIYNTLLYMSFYLHILTNTYIYTYIGCIFRVCRSVHLHTFKWINQLHAAINYRFIVSRL